MRVFAVVKTQENELRFAMLRKEHGLLYDKQQQKTYAIIRDAHPTNWKGKWSRAYLVHETAAQTIELDGKSVEIHGGTVEVKEPLNMVAKVKLGSRRGEDGAEREVHLTAETIFDRTQSVQIRRLGNRRFQWFHALLFVSLGVAICLALVAAITLFTHSDEKAPGSPPVIITTGNGGAAPQSGPALTPAPQIIVQSELQRPTGG